MGQGGRGEGLGVRAMVSKVFVWYGGWEEGLGVQTKVCKVFVW